MTGPIETEQLPLKKADVPRETRRWVKPAVLVTLLGVLFVLARVLDLDEHLRHSRSLIEGMGPWGPIGFVLIYIAVTVAMIPAWPLTLLAGVLFHWAAGVIYVSIGATTGAAICFLIARYVARDAVARWVADRRAFRKLNDLTDQHGAWVVAITRLVPIFPYNVINYAFGLTAVRFGTYTFWSWLCMLPGTLVYVLGSDAITRILETQQVPWPMVIFVAALIGLMTLVAWYGGKQWKAAAARRRARTAPRDEESQSSPGDASS